MDSTAAFIIANKKDISLVLSYFLLKGFAKSRTESGDYWYDPKRPTRNFVAAHVKSKNKIILHSSYRKEIGQLLTG